MTSLQFSVMIVNTWRSHPVLYQLLFWTKEKKSTAQFHVVHGDSLRTVADILRGKLS